MKTFSKVSDLKQELSKLNPAGIGFVPTMGALHAGHRSLVEMARRECETVVVSVFVNPTQFNDKNDLRNYPRTPEADAALLEAAGADYVLMPSVEEIYPEPDTRVFSFAPLDTVMEGACRAGHFNGVAQIVSKLFYAVNPDRAYFGEKDFQQLAIIRRMVRDLNIPVEIIGCPIVRENDGLALSSRNMLLTDEERQRALTISRTLFASVKFAEENTLAATKAFVEDEINATSGLKLEYFQIVDGNTLQEIKEWNDSDYIVGCIALFCGNFSDDVEVGQAGVFHVGSSQTVDALLQAVCEDGNDAQNFSAMLTQDVDDIDSGTACGDQVLDNDDLSALLDAAFDLVVAAVVLSGSADISHGQIEDVGNQSAVCDTGCGCTGDNFDLGILSLDDVSQTLLDNVTNLGVGQCQTVVAVDGGLDAGSPCEGLVGTEENRLDIHEQLSNLLFHNVQSPFIYICIGDGSLINQ